jgi:hypothetical protein
MRFKVCLLGFLLPLVSVASAQQLPVLFDPRIKTPKPQFTTQETRQIDQDMAMLVKNSVSRDFKKSIKDCGVPTPKDLMGRASGSFLQAQAKEVLFSTRICDGEEGLLLMIYRDKRLMQAYRVALKALSGLCGATEVFSVKDINQNGLSELGMSWGCYSASVGGSLEILEFLPTKIQVIFRHHNGISNPFEGMGTGFIFHVIKASKPTVIGQHINWLERTQSWVLTNQLEVLQSDPERPFVMEPLIK